MTTEELILRLCAADGTSGDEEEAARAAAAAFPGCARTAVDALGNLTAVLNPGAEPGGILLDAHLDKIGLAVTGIDENGFLRVAPCGGVDRRVLPGAPVTVRGREPLPGVVCCPPRPAGDEKLPAADRMAVDIGCPRETAEKLVRPGDRVVFAARPKRLLGTRVSAPGLDDRAGVAALARCAQMLAQRPPRRRVTFLCSTREEVGGQGAVTGAWSAAPELGIAVDVGFARQPGVPEEKSGTLGGGPMIGFAPALDRRIGEALASLAEKLRIPYGRDVMGGDTGTNSDVLAAARGGVRTGLVSIPLRYMHTPAEVADARDVENTALLLAEYIRGAE